MNHDHSFLSLTTGTTASTAITVVFRTRVSPYFSADFLDRERRAVESLPGHYHLGTVVASGLKTRLHSYLTQRKIVNFSPEQVKLKLVLLSGAQTAAKDLEPSEWSQVQLLLQAISGAENLAPIRPLLPSNSLVLRAPTLRAQAVMQYNLYCLLHALGPVPFVTDWDLSRSYPRLPLSQQNVLILGLGFTGAQLRLALTPLVANLYLVDPLVAECYRDYREVPLQKVNAIFICAQVDERFPLKLDRSFFEQLSPHVILINTARGELLNTNDLLQFLEQHPASRAYLDVFEQEPANFKSWTALLNRQLFVSSHVAGVDDELEQRHLDWLRERLLHWSQLQVEKFKQLYHRELL